MAKRQDVTSREYKVVLAAERFTGDEAAMREAAATFWRELGTALADLGIATKGSFDVIKARRLVRFFDTDEHRLHDDSYIVREREDVLTGEREITLKFRHPDRYIAADRSMEGRSPDAKTKFEEDVKPPFVSAFSFSTTQPLKSGHVLEQLGDVAKLFPGLADAIDDLPVDAPLVLVRDFVGHEVVLEGAFLELGGGDVEGECAFVVWYDQGEEDTTPVIVEFSFKYGDGQGQFRSQVAKDAYAALGLLQQGLPQWVDPEPVTKTAFVYA